VSHQDVPSKDTGLDVEGLAADASTLYIRLRGPILRGHVIVVRLSHAARMSFLQLGGLGIRSLALSQHGGLWLLAGPTMDLDASFTPAHWDGTSSAFVGHASEALAKLSRLPHGEALAPEGVFVRVAQLCVLFDGPRGGPRAACQQHGCGPSEQTLSCSTSACCDAANFLAAWSVWRDEIGMTNQLALTVQRLELMSAAISHSPEPPISWRAETIG
jgi:hypothetical protein